MTELVNTISSLDDIEIINFKELGFGYISKVKMCRDKKTGKNYAIKIVN